LFNLDKATFLTDKVEISIDIFLLVLALYTIVSIVFGDDSLLVRIDKTAVFRNSLNQCIQSEYTTAYYFADRYKCHHFPLIFLSMLAYTPKALLMNFN
jgi:hypothetical protein